ncbi:hypothetical protein Hanom_Chr09g00786601 [Helianthus anomalus]
MLTLRVLGWMVLKCLHVVYLHKVPASTYQNSLSYHGSAVNAIRFSLSAQYWLWSSMEGPQDTILGGYFGLSSEHYVRPFTQRNRRLTFAMFLVRCVSVSQITYYLLLRNTFRNTNQMRFKKLYMALIGK